jgi:hypothetical protein
MAPPLALLALLELADDEEPVVFGGLAMLVFGLGVYSVLGSTRT